MSECVLQTVRMSLIYFDKCKLNMTCVTLYPRPWDKIFYYFTGKKGEILRLRVLVVSMIPKKSSQDSKNSKPRSLSDLQTKSSVVLSLIQKFAFT